MNVKNKILKKETIYSFFNPVDGSLMVKHWNFYLEIMKAVQYKSQKRIFFFGGGVRGGKSFLCLFALLRIAKLFPGVKIHIIRNSMPVIQSTIEQSFLKLCKEYKRFNRDKGNYFVEFHNKSRIYFFAEQYDSDKDLDRFKGLETNIIFLEQIEELQEKTFEKAQERLGSWRFKGEPNPIILSTFNPTNVEWIRETVYYPYKIQDIPYNYHIEMVTAKDNPFVAEHQWEIWKNKKDKKSYQQYIEGDWDVLTDVNIFAYSFDRNKHVQSVEKRYEYIYLSFDFNVNPSVCLLAHIGDNHLHIFSELRIENSNVYEIIEGIENLSEGLPLFITGDASGRSRSHLLKDNMNTYDIIKRELNITHHSFHVPKSNLGLFDSRQIVNATLEHMDVRIDSSCKYLIEDLLTVEVDTKGSYLHKTRRDRDISIDKRDSTKTHLLDCFRYYCNTYFAKKF